MKRQDNPIQARKTTSSVKTRQYDTIHDNTSLDTRRQYKATQAKTRANTTSEDKTKQDKTREIKRKR